MNRFEGNIGFIGLGLMGAAMAQNLLVAGASLVVCNRTAAKAAPLVKGGARLADNPAAVARDVGAGLIILCVTDTPALENAVASNAGLLADLAPGALVIDMGTTEVEVTRSVASAVEDRGARFIDAPMSGGQLGAVEGALTIMAGGRTQDIERAGPVFDVLGKSTTRIGDVGAGQVAKTANQMIVGNTVATVAEALLPAERGGAEPNAVRQALLGGFAGSRILEVHGQRMIDRTFAPGARATTQLKDMRQAVAYAHDLGIELPMTSLCRDLWEKMVDRDMGGLDQSGFFAMLDKENPPE